MKIKIFLLVVISILLIINFSSCFFKISPSEIILVSPADDTDVFFEVIQFKWKLANHAFGVTYDFYLGNSIDDMQLIQSSISDE